MARTLAAVSLLLVLSAPAACGDDSSATGDGGMFRFDGAPDAQPPPEDASRDATRPDTGPPPELPVVVWACSGTELFSVDPEHLTLASVGTFASDDGSTLNPMLDIAVNAAQELYGVTRSGLYRIDTASAGVTLVAAYPMERQFNGLSFLPAGMLGSSGETLIGDTADGQIYRIDLTTATQTLVGSYAAPWVSSGDIVSVTGEGTFATVKNPMRLDDNDRLVELDPMTGAVRVVGDTGVKRIFGLGYWRHKLYGFTRDGDFVEIDVDTGAARTVMMGAAMDGFYGAGVTTIAPIAPF